MRKDVKNQVSKTKGMCLVNKSEMARRFGCDRRTVGRYLCDELPSPKANNRRKSILDPFKATVLEKVDTYGATSMAVFKFIQKKGYEGGYLTVHNFVKAHRENEIRKATIRFETSPGLQAQVDWKEELKMINRSGEIFRVNIFLIVLGYSRLKFIRLTSDRRQTTLFQCLFFAFGYFRGVPHEVLFDNMKTVVDRSKSTFQNVVLNSTFRAFAQDAGFEVITCRSYRAQTKGKVETLAKLVGRLKAYNGEFDTFEDLEKIVDDFRDEINAEISQGTNEVPSERFLSEQEYLGPLPYAEVLRDYFCREKTYKVFKDSMIKYNGQKYSVPTRFIGSSLTVGETDSEIHIYYDEDIVACHPKSDKFLNYKREHAFEILTSDAFVDSDPETVERYVENTLSKMDLILS
jgi:transposase